MGEFTQEELERMKEILAKESRPKKRRKRMKSGKKALFLAFGICVVLTLFTMAMIYLGRDTTSLTILATAGVGILPVMYGIYDKHETQINLKHMEKNYIPDYDDREGIY
jgi:FtsH-binding integral membrane protein